MYRYIKFHAEFASFHRYTLWLHALRHVASWSKEASKPKTWPSPPKLRRSWKLGFQVQSFESAVSMEDSELTTNGLESYWESDDTWPGNSQHPEEIASQGSPRTTRALFSPWVRGINNATLALLPSLCLAKYFSPTGKPKRATCP